MLKRMLLAYGGMARAFHAYVAPLFTFSAILMLQVVVSVGMVLDHVFFPSLRRKRIVKPVIIVGNPRSGTTFLQRYLVDNGYGSGMRIWKMMFPSLTLQALLKPLVPLMEKFSPARFHAHAAHETNLTAVETDDPSLLFRYFDGLFLYGFFLAWYEKDLKSMFDPAVRDTSQRDFDWLEEMWCRNLISEKQERVVSKLFSLGMRIPLFIKKFPDAKILYMVRDPLETVPSGLSLVTGVLDGRFGFWNLPEAKRQHYIERLYSAFLELSLRFHDDYINHRIPKENIMIVTYSKMMRDFEKVMRDINQFIGVTPTPVVLQNIKNTAERQRNYISKHQYDLQKFGLTEERIRRDYQVIIKTFLK
jgi:omega-hydroxy-beta-dihydromenaquinone-9 sulfotransferase